MSTTNLPNTEGSEGGGLGETIDSLTSLLGPLSALLGPLEISRNVNLVKEFGLNSWGASTSPEQATAQFSNQAVVYVQGLLKSTNDSNLENNINEIEKYLSFVYELEKHKLNDHSRASSTKAGRKVIMNLAFKLRGETSRAMILKAIKSGITVVKTDVIEKNDSISYNWSPTDNSFHSEGGYTYRSYKLEYDSSMFDMTNGNIEQKSKMNLGSMSYVLGGFAILWIMGLVKFSKK